MGLILAKYHLATHTGLHLMRHVSGLILYGMVITFAFHS
jgi:hypothetical protein